MGVSENIKIDENNLSDCIGLHISGYHGRLSVSNKAKDGYATDVLCGEEVSPDSCISYQVNFDDSCNEAYSLDMLGVKDNNTKLPAFISLNFINDDIYDQYFLGTIEKNQQVEFNEFTGAELSQQQAYYIEINVKESDFDKYFKALNFKNIGIQAFGYIHKNNGRGIIEQFTLLNEVSSQQQGNDDQETHANLPTNNEMISKLEEILYFNKENNKIGHSIRWFMAFITILLFFILVK